MTRFVLWLKANASTIFLSIHVKNVMQGQLVCMLYWEWLDIFFFVTNSENLCFAVTFLLQLPLSLLEVPNIRRRNKNCHYISSMFGIRNTSSLFGDDKYLVSGMGCS